MEEAVAFIQPKDWKAEMIKLEGTPTELREITVTAFCEKYGITRTDYYYHRNKTENAKLILKSGLDYAKTYTSDVLNTLAKKAKNGSEKSIELYLKYVLELSEKLKLGEDPENPFRTIITDKEKQEIDKIYATLVKTKDRSSEAEV